MRFHCLQCYNRNRCLLMIIHRFHLRKCNDIETTFLINTLHNVVQSVSPAADVYAFAVNCISFIPTRPWLHGFQQLSHTPTHTHTHTHIHVHNARDADDRTCDYFRSPLFRAYYSLSHVNSPTRTYEPAASPTRR